MSEIASGRWSVDFLNKQLAKLVHELSKCEEWRKSSVAGVREDVEDNATTGNALDCATIDMRLFVSAIALETSHQKIRDIRTALMFIDADLKSDRMHKYGKCVDCGERIEQKRLEASSWVQKCLFCQDSSEASRPDQKIKRRRLPETKLVNNKITRPHSIPFILG